MRGFASIGLVNAKDPLNIGEVMRAAGCYGAAMVAVSGGRFKHARTDTQKAHRHLPAIETDDIFSVMPFGAVPVAVELVESAISIVEYSHPTSAFYLFGPEDGSLPADVVGRCRDVIYVPTSHCMNLAATVNVVLYDRMQKAMRALARRAA